jgi:hypothetical protein
MVLAIRWYPGRRALGRTSFREAQYKGVADTIVQLIRRSTSGVIAQSQSARERTVETCQRQLGSLTRNMGG